VNNGPGGFSLDSFVDVIWRDLSIGFDSPTLRIDQLAELGWQKATGGFDTVEGHGTNYGGTISQFQVVSIPEPSSLAIAGLSAVLWLGCTWCRRDRLRRDLGQSARMQLSVTCLQQNTGRPRGESIHYACLIRY
jgi:hypothetical protein